MVAILGKISGEAILSLNLIVDDSGSSCIALLRKNGTLQHVSFASEFIFSWHVFIFSLIDGSWGRAESKRMRMLLTMSRIARYRIQTAAWPCVV